MPANRSRTQGWRRSLTQVLERRGSLEIAIATSSDATSGHHLVWRVRLLRLTEREIIVEQPSTIGSAIELDTGIELVVILAVGQNRWMFKADNLGTVKINSGRRSTTAIRLRMPESVLRCQRRNHYRVEATSISPPEVEMWPLLDPKSVVVAERANELRIQADQAGTPLPSDQTIVMPEVGPCFTGMLVNIGGGGVGVRVRPQDDQMIGRSKLFWMRLSLPPTPETPICATAKLAHTNIDSAQHTYAGLAFDFSFNTVHQSFVVEQIRRYIVHQQEAQRTGAPQRKSA